MNYEIYKQLISNYPEFIFDSYETTIEEDKLILKFRYVLTGVKEEEFFHKLIFPYNGQNINDPLFENIVINIGIVEAFNYLKLTSSPKFIVRPCALTKEQSLWWEKLIFLGLGEYLYINGIYNHVDEENFIKVIGEGTKKIEKVETDINFDGNLILVGGGKDSVVSLDLLKEDLDKNYCMMINPGMAGIKCANIGGYENKTVNIKRILSKRMFEMNGEEFLNGHIPISSVFAFISLLSSFLYKTKYIVLSNEKSANEPTVEGTKINHQYSKTFEFENDFNKYVNKYISSDLKYFSLLRNMHEVEIAERFSKLKEYHSAFISCNLGGRDGVWCGKCPKCLFVYIILAPYLEPRELKNIFGYDMFENEELEETFLKLLGEGNVKPFECVGTINEVIYSLNLLLDKRHQEDKPFLIKKYLESVYSKIKVDKSLLYSRDNENNIPEEFRSLYEEK